eukprot:GHVN01035138.1.p1 GENE.GHVN01035138.1~~GHVN01035138.1.p1  ORF type:complete len:962 (+),score=166.55 GHVN01035138.1:214-3099(+)
MLSGLGDPRRNTQRSVLQLALAAQQEYERIRSENESQGITGEVAPDFCQGADIKKLTRRVEALRLGQAKAGQRGGTNRGTTVTSLMSGMSSEGTSEILLSHFLQNKYESLLLHLVDESLEDTYRLFASDQLDVALTDWQEDYSRICVEVSSMCRPGCMVSGRIPAADDTAFGAGGGGLPIVGGGFGSTRPHSTGALTDGGDDVDPLTSPSPGYVTTEERLLLQHLTRPSAHVTHLTSANSFSQPEETTTAALSRKLPSLVQWSASTVSPQGGSEVGLGGDLSYVDMLRDECRVIWSIIGSLCGVHGKRGKGASLRQVVLNSLRALEESCEDAVIERLGEQTGSYGQRTKLSDFESIKEFTRLEARVEPAVFGSEQPHYWQMAYWALRTGKPHVLEQLSLMGLDDASDGQQSSEQWGQQQGRSIPPNFNLVCRILSSQLFKSTSSQEARSDNRFTHETVTLRGNDWTPSVFEALEANRGAVSLLDTRPAVGSGYRYENPLAALLMSLCVAGKPSIPLSHAHPNATTEDFLWYNIHRSLLVSSDRGAEGGGEYLTSLTGSQTTDTLRRHLHVLQRKVLRKGPHHFSSPWAQNSVNEAHSSSVTSAPISSLNYAKVLLYTLRVSDAVGWIAENFPDLRRCCLHWALYLDHFGMIGDGSIIEQTLEIPLQLDTLDVGALSAALLSGCSLPVQLAYLPALPWVHRLSLMEVIITQHFHLLAHDSLIGKVRADGSTEQGELYKRLCGEGGADPALCAETIVGVSWNLGEIFEERSMPINAFKCYYMAGRDNDALRALLRAFTSKNLFFAFGQLTSAQVALQGEVYKYFNIFQQKALAGEVNEIVDSSSYWTSVTTACLIAQGFDMTRQNQLEAAIKHFEKHRLVPSRAVLGGWIESPHRSLLPVLIDAYGFCVYETYRRGFYGPTRRAEVVDKAHSLLDVCNALTDGPYSVSSSTRGQLREIIDSAS